MCQLLQITQVLDPHWPVEAELVLERLLELERGMGTWAMLVMALPGRTRNRKKFSVMATKIVASAKPVRLMR
jgi:hypothetical protein